MRSPGFVAISVALFAASHAIAQVGPVIGEIIHHWNLVEVHAGTNTPVATQNGLLEPGESLRMQLTVSFTPPVGTPVNWAPHPPAPGFGTVAGLHAVGFQLASIGATDGMWSHFSRPAGWIGNQAPLPSGWVQGILVGQIYGGGIAINPANPIENIWQGVWTPSSYEPRTIQWRREPTTSFHPFGALAFEHGTDPTTGHTLFTSFAAFTPQYSLPVTIIPAPAGGMVLAAGSFIMLRRRRAQVQEVAPRGARP